MDFLVKAFIKDYDKIDDIQVRTRYGILSSSIGIICNLVLFVIKFTIGVLIHSISVMADAFNNLSDSASSIISFIGVKLASKPADADHPFGHGRIEYISAFIVAFLVIQVGFTLFKSSFGKLSNPQELTFSWVSIFMLLLSILVKLWLGFLNKRLGERIHSSVMKATAADSIGDVVVTSATIFSILIYGIFGLNIDGIIGMIVSVAVMIAGINIAKDILAPLIGEAIDPEIYETITNFVQSYDGITGSHDLIVHNYGPSRSMASIHAEVPNDRSIEESHEVIDRVERAAAKQLGILLVIHMDPVETKDNRVAEYRIMIEQLLLDMDSRLTTHDFRMVDGQECINLIFDLVVPHEYNHDKQEILKLRIIEQVELKDIRCHCTITMEKSYIAEA